MANLAIIAAAGFGRRFGNMPKQFAMLKDKPLLYYSLKSFDSCSFIDRIVIAVYNDHMDLAKKLVYEYNPRKKFEIIPGGQTRQESVYEALKSSPGFEYVLVHDVARPLVTQALVKNVFEGTKEVGACIPSVPVTDTIKKGGKYVDKTYHRESMFSVQTPQGFNYELLKAAHEAAIREGFAGTDDSSLVERLGCKVKMIPGNQENIKVTYSIDLEIADRILERRNQNSKEWD